MVKFLVIRFSSIGDIVLTTPVVRGLHEQVSHAEVHYLTRKEYAGLLRDNPHIQKIHILSERQDETIKALKKEGFDYVIDLQNNLRSLMIKRSLKRMYFTVSKLNVRKWILVNLKINKMPDRHIVDRYMDTVQLFDVQDDQQGLDHFIPVGERISLSSLPDEFQRGYVVMAIGAKHITKKMTPGQLQELAGALHLPVVIIGGKEDRPVGEQIVAAHPGQPILNGCGEWNLNQSASVIEQAACVITHDTGMMHLAAAFRKKIITIWGNTLPALGMYPYRSDKASVSFEVEGLRCRPCSKLGKKACPKKHFRCMLDHDLQKIADTANRLSSSVNYDSGIDR